MSPYLQESMCKTPASIALIFSRPIVWIANHSVVRCADTNALDGFVTYRSATDGSMRVADGMFGLFPYSPTAVMAVRELFKPTAVNRDADRGSKAGETLVPAAFTTAEHRRRGGGKQQQPQPQPQPSASSSSSSSSSVFSRLLSRFDATSAPVAFLASRTFFPFQVCCSSMAGQSLH